MNSYRSNSSIDVLEDGRFDILGPPLAAGFGALSNELNALWPITGWKAIESGSGSPSRRTVLRRLALISDSEIMCSN